MPKKFHGNGHFVLGFKGPTKSASSIGLDDVSFDFSGNGPTMCTTVLGGDCFVVAFNPVGNTITNEDWGPLLGVLLLVPTM